MLILQTIRVAPLVFLSDATKELPTGEGREPDLPTAVLNYLDPLVPLFAALLGALLAFLAGWVRDGKRVRDERRARHEDHVLEAVSELLAIGGEAAKAAAAMREAVKGQQDLLDQEIDILYRADHRRVNHISAQQRESEKQEEKRRSRADELLGHMQKIRPLQLKLKILTPSLEECVEAFVKTVKNASHSSPASSDSGAITTTHVDTVSSGLIEEAQRYLAVARGPNGAPSKELVMATGAFRATPLV